MRNLVLLAGAGLVIAAAPAGDRGAVLKAVTDCRSIKDGAARLACYDGAVGRLDEAAAKKEIVVLDREEVRQTRRGLFGFVVPKLPMFKGDEAQEAPTQIDAVASSARSLGYGKWRIVLEDGAIWMTTETGLPRDPRTGSKIRIKTGAMGNFFLSVDGSRSVRARRDG